MRTLRSGRAGFSLVELLVVIAIIAVIVALLLPALHLARQSSLRIRCLNNLRQLGLALHTYESRSQVFPPGYVTGFRPDGEEDGIPGAAWSALLLPSLEQTQLFTHIDFNAGVIDPANQTARITRASVFVCPGDPEQPNWAVREGLPDSPAVGPILGEAAPSSYVGVAGPGPIGPESTGFFVRNRSIRFSEVRDGMSETVAIGERSHRLGPAVWIGVVPHASLGPSDSADRLTIGGPAMVLGRAGGESGPGGPATPPDGFQGNHAVAGAHFVFGDGSVRFISATIQPPVYRALATPNGGEMLSDEP